MAQAQQKALAQVCAFCGACGAGGVHGVGFRNETSANYSFREVLVDSVRERAL